MLETSARLLRLLSLLQTHRDWSGPELAQRLAVTTRTVRNDVERLRSLGYPVHATPGVAGGYRLGAGAALPPLLLDDEEAIAVAVGLGTAATGSVAGIGETSVRALAKLERILPTRLRHRVRALQHAIVAIPGSGPAVDAQILTTLANACRDNELLRLDYTGHDGAASVRAVEPHRLVSSGRRWYLVAWDVERGDWRTFRADRISPRTPAGPRFTPRPLPADDLAAYVSRGSGTATWQYRATVRVHAGVERVAARMPYGIGQPKPDGPDRCLITVGSDNVDMLAGYLGMLDADFEVIDAPELAQALHRLADRLHRAAGDR